MEKQTLTVLNGLGTLFNAVIWEINDNEPLNDGILEQLEFLIKSGQFY